MDESQNKAIYITSIAYIEKKALHLWFYMCVLSVCFCTAGDPGVKGDKGERGEDGVGIKGSPGAPGAPGKAAFLSY